MKILLSIIILLLISTSVAFAEENKQLTALREIRKKAIKTEKDKLNKNLKTIEGAYIKKLEVLLKALMQEGDLDGALEVRALIKKLKNKKIKTAALTKQKEKEKQEAKETKETKETKEEESLEEDFFDTP